MPDSFELSRNAEQYLNKSDYRDSAQQFQLIKLLFEYAEQQGLMASKYSDYHVDLSNPAADTSTDNPKAISLPPNFALLVTDQPGEYFIVDYKNAPKKITHPKFAFLNEEARGREILLSTARKQGQTDQKIGEIKFAETNSPDSGKKIEVSITQSVNNKSYKSINDAEVVKPHGQLLRTYELDPKGIKIPKRLHISRIDESYFEKDGRRVQVRLGREFEVSNKIVSDNVLSTYEEFYLVGRPIQRIVASISIEGPVNEP